MRLSILAMIIALGLPALAQAQRDTSILADEYIVTQEFVEAQVLRVNYKERKLTVRGASKGQTRVFSVAEGARISIKGRQASLRDIRRGDTVMVAVKPQATEVVITQVKVPQTNTDLSARLANPVVAEAMPAMLPKTASPWPTILLTGLLALIGAGLMRKARISN